MTLWMLWSIATSALIATAAVALERAASFFGAPRRFVWLGALIAAMLGPAVIGLRRAPFAPRPSARSFVERATNPSVGVSTASFSGRQVAGQTHPGSQVVVQPDARTFRRVIPPTAWREQFVRWAVVIGHIDTAVAIAWLTASSILLLALIAAMMRLRVRRSHWTTTNTEFGRVDVAPDVGPAVIGFFRPRIVLPAWALSMESTARGLLLRHELEHLRANDTRALLAGELAIIAFPWNAPLWWMVRRLRLAVEVDCDARVIRACANAYEYGAMLLTVSERFATVLPLAASLLERRSGLDARIAAIVEPRRSRRFVASLPFLAIAGITLVTAAWTPRPRPLLHAHVAATPTSDTAISSHRVVPGPTALVVQPSRTITDSLRTSVASDRRTVTVSPEPSSLARRRVRPEPPAGQSDDSLLAAVGYLARKQLGRGFFMDGEMVDHQSATFSMLLRVIPGFRVSPSGNGRTYVIEDARTNGCVNTFVDGTLWIPLTPGDIDESVRPSELLALEAYHRSGAPPQFTPRDARECATVIVWTRARAGARRAPSPRPTDSIDLRHRPAG